MPEPRGIPLGRPSAEAAPPRYERLFNEALAETPAFVEPMPAAFTKAEVRKHPELPPPRCALTGAWPSFDVR